MFRKKVTLPESADWIVEGKIAAMPLPSEGELRQLRDMGFGLVVNLTEKPFATQMAAKIGLKGAHLPIADLAAPDRQQVHDFVSTVERYVSEGKPVAVHCLGGQGRTGTMIACYLVKQGMAPWDAIDEVRRRRPGSIETDEQERAVVQYAKSMREPRPDSARRRVDLD